MKNSSAEHRGVRVVTKSNSLGRVETSNSLQRRGTACGRITRDYKASHPIRNTSAYMVVTLIRLRALCHRGCYMKGCQPGQEFWLSDVAEQRMLLRLYFVLRVPSRHFIGWTQADSQNFETSKNLSRIEKVSSASSESSAHFKLGQLMVETLLDWLRCFHCSTFRYEVPRKKSTKQLSFPNFISHPFKACLDWFQKCAISSEKRPARTETGFLVTSTGCPEHVYNECSKRLSTMLL